MHDESCQTHERMAHSSPKPSEKNLSTQGRREPRLRRAERGGFIGNLTNEAKRLPIRKFGRISSVKGMPLGALRCGNPTGRNSRLLVQLRNGQLARVRSRVSRSQLLSNAACSQCSVPWFALRHAREGIGSAQVLRQNHGRAVHMIVDNAACGITVAMPNAGSCRIPHSELRG